MAGEEEIFYPEAEKHLSDGDLVPHAIDEHESGGLHRRQPAPDPACGSCSCEEKAPRQVTDGHFQSHYREDIDMIHQSTPIVAFDATAGPAVAQQTPDQRTTQFLKTDIQGNIAEVQLATLGEQHAGSGDVREFADTLANDHENALDKTTSIAEDLGIVIPEEPSEKARHTYERLARLSGDEFDRRFVEVMVKNQESTIGTYRSYLQATQDGSRATEYAKGTMPMLEDHLERTRTLSDQAQGR